MPSPHSTSSHSSSSSNSASGSGSSHSSGSSFSHSSSHSSWSSTRSAGSSYDSWDSDSGSGSHLSGAAQLVILIITLLIVLAVYLYNKNVSSVKTNAQPSPAVVGEGQAAVWDDEYGGYVMKKFILYSNGERKYLPIEKTGEENTKSSFQNGSAEERKLSDLELFGRELHLTERVPGVWRIAEDGGKTLLWDDGEQSYYDADSELWVWYNTDVEPPLWQYWYEPISGNYGKYGWMEYENEVWYIESSQGRWIEVPEKYDTSPLWHIETDD